MRGNSLNEFIDNLYYNPEKEISYQGIKYIVSGFIDDAGEQYTLQATMILEEPKVLFTHTSKDRGECVNAFEKAPIFNGKTIYEAENEIEVLFG